MTQHLILGYGYCGYYLARELLKNGQQVTALSRHLDADLVLPKLKHTSYDLQQPFTWEDPDTIIYYLIPPSPTGDTDIFLNQFLSKSNIKSKKIIYFGSSGVYGDHQGAWVDEQSPCIINNSRQLRRLDAEQQWLTYCEKNNINLILLRIAGIYGPHRISYEAAKTQVPLIDRKEAPYTNQIYVNDLATIAYLLAKIHTTDFHFNIADGIPQPMGSLQQTTAAVSGLAPAPFQPWSQAWENASPMKREFMQSSKRLDIKRLKQTLGSQLVLTDIKQAVRTSLNNK